MTEKIYGFVDTNKRLISTCVAQDNDVETLDRIQIENNADAYYEMNPEKELMIPGVAFWNGTRFLWDSPYPSWIWSEEENNWIPPVEYPNTQGIPYEWDEATVSWIQTTPSSENTQLVESAVVSEPHPE